MLIARHRFDPSRLEVEVTETAILADAQEVRQTMAKLHALGLRIALDDFGVGYSSLSHLRLFPFDKLKIDQTFVADCCLDVQSATLIHAVTSIGRALGRKVVAEGVENDQQEKFLRAAGVHAFQGYLYRRARGHRGAEATGSGACARDSRHRINQAVILNEKRHPRKMRSIYPRTQQLQAQSWAHLSRAFSPELLDPRARLRRPEDDDK